MILTDDEKRMRDGAEGAAVAAAMDYQRLVRPLPEGAVLTPAGDDDN